MKTDLLTARQAAVVFGVHPATVKTWAERGKLAGFRTPGGHWRFRREDVEAAVTEGTPVGAA